MNSYHTVSDEEQWSCSTIDKSSVYIQQFLISKLEEIVYGLTEDFITHVVLEDHVHASCKTTASYIFLRLTEICQSCRFQLHLESKEVKDLIHQCFLNNPMSMVYFHAYYSRINLASRTVLWKICNSWKNGKCETDLVELYSQRLMMHIERRHGIPSHFVSRRLVRTIISGAITNLLQLLQYGWDDDEQSDCDLSTELYWRKIIDRIPIEHILMILRRTIVILRAYKKPMRIIFTNELNDFINVTVDSDIKAGTCARNIVLERIVQHIFPSFGLQYQPAIHSKLLIATPATLTRPCRD